MGTVDQIGQRRWSHGAIDSCDCIFQRRTIQQGPFRADYETEEVRLTGGGQGKGKAGCLAQSRKGGGQQEVGPGVCQFPGLPGVELQRLVNKQRLSGAVGRALILFVRLSDYCRIVILPILVVFFFDFGFIVFIVVRISRRHCRLPFAIAAYSSS